MTELRYPEKIKEFETNPAAIRFGFFQRNTPWDSSPVDSILLYMPQAVSQPSTVEWSADKIGFVGAAAVSLAQGSGLGMGRGSRSHNMDGAAELLDKRMGAEVAETIVKGMGGSASSEQLAGAGAGVAFNPYLTMLFKGVNFRNFSFVFKFVPFSLKDCEMIDDIIRMFRHWALPAGSGARGGAGPILEYPGECEIEYQWKGAKNPWLHKFTRSVCTGVSVEYTGQGMFAVMENGFPANITLTTTWSEIHMILRDDVRKGGGGY